MVPFSSRWSLIVSFGLYNCLNDHLGRPTKIVNPYLGAHMKEFIRDKSFL